MTQNPSRRLAVARRLRIVLLATAFAAVGSLSSLAMAQRGDMNCDGAVNQNDVLPFVLALIDPAAYAAAYPNCNITRADMNGDTLIDGLDTQAFVAALLVGPPQCFGGQLWCAGRCVEVQLDPDNCGSCGHGCGPGENCAGGICQPAEPCPGCGP